MQSNRDLPEAHNGLAVALHMLGRHEEAVAHYRRSLELRPNHARVLENLGNALIACASLAEAAACFRQAVTLQPDLATAHNGLGRALKELGQLSEARQAIERALELEPRQPLFYRCLADLKRFTEDDGHLATMAALGAHAADLPVDDQINLHFALGKACADVGRPEQSFRHFCDGNRLKRQQVEYDEATALGMFDRVRAVFNARLMDEKAGLGHPSAAPVFVVGMPRSGTTLIEQILASHPQVHGAGEITLLDEAVIRLGQSGPVRASYPEMTYSLKGAQLYALGAEYVAALQVKAPSADRIVDKLPANFLLLGLIHLALPNARIIHARRDPMDTCLSCFANLFSGQPQTYDLGELGRHFRAYQKLMRHWREVLPAGVMLDVDYEELVADLPGVARRMVAHCSLGWDAACLDFHRTERPVTTVSAVQVRLPIYRSAVGRSQAYGPLLQPLVDALEGRTAPPASPASGAFKPLQRRRSPEPAEFATAMTWHQKGNLRKAERLYRVALRRNGSHFESLYNLGRLLLEQERRDEAEEFLREAVRQDPTSAEAYNSLGVVLQMGGRIDEAAPCFEAALSLKPVYPNALANLGNCNFALNRLAEAEACFAKVISLQPDLAAAHYDFGRTQQALGRVEKARRAFETAVVLDPRRAPYWRSLAEVKRFAPDDPGLRAMAELTREEEALTEDDRIHLHFALGKALDDARQYAPAFQHMTKGNALMRRRISYDEVGTLAEFANIKAAFSPTLMREKADIGDQSTVPVFIIGMPRSGTTLVEQILASHPQIFGAGELSHFQVAAAQLLQLSGSVQSFSGLMQRISDQQLGALGASYAKALHSAAPDAARITNKMPANFLLAGLIALALPNARIIHVRRDPLDTCFSCFATVFLGYQPFSYQLDELGRYYAAYEDLMEHWRSVLPASIMLEVDYEEVVNDLPVWAPRLVAHCGLEWNDACLSFHETNRPIRTASWAQVRRPINRDSIGRSRPYEHLMGPLLQALHRGATLRTRINAL